LSFSGMLFLMLLGLVIFGPKKLPQVGERIGRMLAELNSFTRDFKSQLKIEMEGASKQEKIAPASLPQSKSPTEIGTRTLETGVFGTKHGRVEAFHG
jgi:Sec-independent protein translocase protein TatA